MTQSAQYLFPGLGCSEPPPINQTTSIVPVFLDNSQAGLIWYAIAPLCIPNPPFSYWLDFQLFLTFFLAVQGGKNLAPRLFSSTSLSPCIGTWIEYILTLWADGSAVGLVDLLTSLRKLCLLYPLFSLFWKREVGGQGPPIPLAYNIISSGSSFWRMSPPNYHI